MAGAIFVVAGTTAGQQGPVAALVSAAGWADAGRRVLGASWLVTAGGVVDPAVARSRASDPALGTAAGPGVARRVPTVAKTAVKDVRQWRRAGAVAIDPDGPWSGEDLAFVWQRHELFSGAGIRLGRALGTPVVLFVPATLVWESAEWGVNRPGWGRLLEQRVEGPALRAADLLACGSDLVAEQAVRLGVPEARVLITPTGADVDAIHPGIGRDETRAAHGVGDRFVVGWVGSFRRFHGLERAVEAVASLERAVLLLVGDGPERPRIEALARERGVEVVTTGTVGHDQVPHQLAAMDVALVLAPPGGAFHYSPLKLAEYLAAGLPVVAPRVGQLEDRLTDGVDAVLVPPGDTEALAAALRRLQTDPTERARLGAAARASAVDHWSWDEQIRRIRGHATFRAVTVEPTLSVVVVAYDMARELPRTLRSLAAPYQRGIEAGDVEVVVVDNGSPEPVDASLLAPFGSGARLLRIDPAPPSPVVAANRGIDAASGDLVGLLLDGARLASPGLLARARQASRLAERPVITAPAFHLGEATHMDAAEVGYDQAAEDRLLDGCRWEEDGYRLFEVSTLAGSSARGFFGPMGESNSLFLRRDTWAALGGLDERFALPGGGLANHDLYRRACGLDGAELVVLLGEGTFHQFHGGAATSRRHGWDEMHEDYQRIRGIAHQPPSNRPLFLGQVPTVALAHLDRSVRWAVADAAKRGR